MSHPSLGPGKLAPGVINAIVEIPTGSRVKYEFDHDTGMIFVDRTLGALIRDLRTPSPQDSGPRTQA